MENLLIFAVVACAALYIARRLLFRAACGCGCGSGTREKKGRKDGEKDENMGACAACPPDISGTGGNGAKVGEVTAETGAENVRPPCCSCGE